MFQTLQLEVMERFASAKDYFRASRGFSGKPAQAARGIAFIEIYGIWEYTVLNVVKIACQEISGHGLPYSQLRTSLLPLFMYSDLQSLRAVGEKDVWDRAMELFAAASSNRPAVLNGSPLPIDGSHFRHTHLQLIFKVFGIARQPTRRRRHLYRITEVVNKRNIIAHGEETSGDVGKRYSRREISLMIRQMESVCLRMISLFSDHCSVSGNHCR
jgi:hypothetical protein